MSILPRTFRGLLELPQHPYCEVNRLRSGEDGRAFINFPVEITANYPEDTLVIVVGTVTKLPLRYRGATLSTASNYSLLAGDPGEITRVLSDMLSGRRSLFSMYARWARWDKANVCAEEMVRLIETDAEHLGSVGIREADQIWAHALRIVVEFGLDTEILRQRIVAYYRRVYGDNGFDDTVASESLYTWNTIIDDMEILEASIRS